MIIAIMNIISVLVILFLYEVITTNAQECDTLPSDSILESNLQNLLVSEEGDNPSIDPNLLTVMNTCLAQGMTMGSYREVSVIVTYNNVVNSPQSRQFDLECVSSGGNLGWQGVGGSLDSAPSGFASLETRTDCSQCRITANNDHDCVACHSDCNDGLMRCTGTGSNQCCPLFDNGACATSCSQNNHVANEQNNYTCSCELSCGSGYVLDSTKCMCNLTDICEAQSPCDNGICVLLSQPDEYFCNCTGTGFNGPNCSSSACNISCGSGYVLDSTKCMCNLTDICEAQSPCDNGICILLSQPDEYFCNCTGTGFNGPNCSSSVPPAFIEVSVCLDVNMDSDTVLDIEYFPCPIIIDPVTTPPIDNYTVTVINNSAINIISVLSEDISADTCDYNVPVSEDNIYTVEMFVNNIIGSSEKRTSDPFIASWLKDVEVKDVTNASATIHYTTADCVVDELDNLKIDLRITGCPIIDPSSPVLYKNATDGNFSLSELQPNDVLTYTLQVITEVMGSTVTIGRIHTGSITVSPIPSSTTTLVTIRATSSVNIVASTCDSSSEGLFAPVSAGITLAISVPVSSIISSLLTLLVVYLCYGKRKGNYSINTTGPVYDTPLPDSNVTRTSEFQMKGNQAYGHVTSAPRSTSEYEIV